MQQFNQILVWVANVVGADLSCRSGSLHRPQFYRNFRNLKHTFHLVQGCIHNQAEVRRA